MSFSWRTGVHPSFTVGLPTVSLKSRIPQQLVNQQQSIISFSLLQPIVKNKLFFLHKYSIYTHLINEKLVFHWNSL